VPPPDNRIVGGVVGLGGKLIRTVSFLGCRFGFGSSPPKSVPTTVPRGGRGGFMENWQALAPASGLRFAYHEFMEADLRISVKDYSRNKNLKSQRPPAKPEV
jgi:hypothetical protein